MVRRYFKALNGRNHHELDGAEAAGSSVCESSVAESASITLSFVSLS